MAPGRRQSRADLRLQCHPTIGPSARAFKALCPWSPAGAQARWLSVAEADCGSPRLGSRAWAPWLRPCHRGPSSEPLTVPALSSFALPTFFLTF